MSKCIDLTGERFGKLTVVKRVENTKQGMAQWMCKCDCGNEIITTGINLRNKHTKSCGCLRIEIQYKNHKKYNQYDLSGEYGIGYTSKGEEFYFDLEDYDKIKNYCWHINKDGYVTSRLEDMMHRIIMDCPSDKLVDHKHGENTRNDNRKVNLRICTRQENNRNRKPSINTKSGVLYNFNFLDNSVLIKPLTLCNSSIFSFLRFPKKEIYKRAKE